jgi:hypothetical protein
VGRQRLTHAEAGRREQARIVNERAEEGASPVAL